MTHQREAQAIVERAVVVVAAVVGGRRPELVQQMAVAFELETVETGLLHALRGGGIVADHPGDVPVLHLLGQRPMGRLAHRRGGENRQPFRLVPVGSPAEMGELDHHRRAVRVAFLGEPPQQRHDLVAIGMEIAEGRRRIARHDGRARGHGEGDAALRLLDMVETVAVARQAVLGIIRLMRRRHQPVLQREMLQPKWLKQRIICAVNGRHDENFALSRTVPQCEWPRHHGIARLQRDSPRGEIPHDPVRQQ